MSIFKKFNDLVRSNLNDWLDKAEDPEKMRAQRLLDLEETKQKAGKLLIRAMGSLKLAQKREALLKIELDEAQTKESPEFQEINARYQELQKLVLEEQKAIDALKEGLKKLEHSFSLVKNQGRAHSEPLADSSLFEEMSRIEEKILYSEALIEAQNELEGELASKNEQKKTESPKTPSLLDEIEELKRKIKNDE